MPHDPFRLRDIEVLTVCEGWALPAVSHFERPFGHVDTDGWVSPA